MSGFGLPSWVERDFRGYLRCGILGEALVQIADMENPPKLFIAGSDALEAIVPAVEARL